MDKEVYRLKTSFSSKKDTLLGQMKETIDRVREFLDGEDKVNPARAHESEPFGFLDRLHEQAAAFHRSLASPWDCSCTVLHEAGLAIRFPSRSHQDKSDRFHLETILHDDRRQLLLSIKALPDGHETSLSDHVTHFGTSASQTDKTSVLKARILIKEQRKLANKTAKGKGVAALVASSCTSLEKPPALESKPQSMGARKRARDFLDSVDPRTEDVRSTKPGKLPSQASQAGWR